MLEALEARVVQTVVFTPNFGAESIAPSSTDDGLKSPVVDLIFQGSYWTGPNGPADKASLLADFKSIVGGPYLSGLTQYGSDGKATIGASPETTAQSINPLALANLPFSTGQLYNFVQTQINQKAIAAPGSQPAIYVVVTDPFATTSDQPNAAGYNLPSTGLHVVWASTAFNSSNRINIDNTTRIFSHELVETISDPDPRGVTVTLPALPAYIVPTGTLQIGDGEPDGGRYSYRLNGVLVQPYWSENDKAFIVPDGNSERFQLQPIWNGSGNNASFSGQYELNVWGDQSSSSQNDQLSVASSNGNTSVSLDGQTVSFDPSKIKYIQLDGGQGTNTFNITGVPIGQEVQVESAGTNDAVNVGLGYILGIQGSVAVVNDSGHNTTVNISDQGDPTPLQWDVKSDSISDGIGDVTFDNIPGSTTNFGAVNLFTTVPGVGAGQSVEVDSAPTAFPLNIYGYGPYYRVFGAAANKTHNYIY